MNQPVVEARNVTRTFAGRAGGDPVPAVADVSLALTPGELVAIAGPSGSGKTTLLHLLAAIDTPTGGDVVFEGAPLRDFSRPALADLRLERIGLVFAERNLCATLTASENVDLPLALRRIPAGERRERVTTALERMGVDHLAGRFPRALSSGEAQRVAVARAVAGDPSLLVLDEPTSHLDSRASSALMTLLAELVAERGMTAVVATHDPGVIAGAPRVVLLRDGRLAEDDR